MRNANYNLSDENGGCAACRRRALGKRVVFIRNCWPIILVVLALFAPEYRPARNRWRIERAVWRSSRDGA